ncbi:MAG: 4-hydroxy-tetrahydrodipicolinate reductase [Lentisphaerae bacterium ADurb.BinA184]|nr:MAG: 4-hydroxy-tetrahydrodipicolinate reductase [Lentisphaerae bacterium ADurb.BinA184]
MIRTVIIGAAGRMGRHLTAQVLGDPALSLAAAIECAGHPAAGQDAGVVAGGGVAGVRITEDLAAALRTADAVIDFSSREAALPNARAAAAAGCALVVGTTGLSAADRAGLVELAQAGARIVSAPNMSIGVNLLFHLCRQVALTLGEEYDIEVVEMHHNQKKDAPSGTAKRLAEILAEARGLSYDRQVRHGREGLLGARPKAEIGMHALRGGDVVGDHTVIFATGGERVELTHKASSRQTFAQGAVRAVKFLAAARPGLYDMQDVLGLKAMPLT